MSIDRKAASRLENVLAMLSSSNDGERANAALMATRMLKELGLDWRAFTQRALAGGEGAAERDGDSELDLYLELLRWKGLTEWERTFMLSLYDRHPKPLTEKQRWHLGRSFESMRQVSAQRRASNLARGGCSSRPLMGVAPSIETRLHGQSSQALARKSGLASFLC